MKATPRIVHVIGSCESGGAECLVRALLLEMKRKGTDVALWVLTGTAEMEPIGDNKVRFEQKFVSDLKSNGIPVEIIGKRPHKDWHLASRRLHDLCRKYTPAIIHTHLESVSFHVVRSACFRNAHLVQTIHSIKIAHPWIMRFVLAPAFCTFVAVSEKVKEVVVRCGIPPQKVSTIYNGIRLDAFAYRDREARKCVRSLVAIGRLAEEKSHKTLISAIRLLKERYHSELRPFPKTTIVGDGELRGALDQLIRREGLEQDVLLAGIKNDIPEVLRTHEIYVMSSIWEGLSISLLEAMASGIPVIATDVGSNSEIVDHGVNGLTVPVAAPEILCEAIYRLIKDRELRQRFSLAGPEKASLFSIEECAQRHLCMYQNIASQ